jgi:predicted DNA-binding ribbon-helix-helix protein
MWGVYVIAQDVQPTNVIGSQSQTSSAFQAQQSTKKDVNQTAPADLQSLIKTDTTKELLASQPQSAGLTSESVQETEQKIISPQLMSQEKEIAVIQTEPDRIQQEKTESVVVTEEEEIKGIDTVDLEEPRGNWLFKRIWWSRAENKYEKIRALFGNILESRMLFFTKRSMTDKDLFAPFYFEIGMSNAELQGTVAQLIEYIDKERKKEGDLSSSGREILHVLLGEKKSLESINADILTINKLDVDIDETVKKMMEQIDRARRYEREAWNSFKDIAHVLSDKKARELFYQMDTAYNNLKDIQEYVNQALSVHLDRVTNMAKTQIERIKSTMDMMKKKGHDLKTLTERIAKKEVIKSEVIEEEEVEQEVEEQGFFAGIFSTLSSGIVGIWYTIVYVVTLPFSWFTSGESNTEEIEQESGFISTEE